MQEETSGAQTPDVRAAGSAEIEPSSQTETHAEAASASTTATGEPQVEEPPATPATAGGGGSGGAVTSGGGGDDGSGDEEDGMLRMSFLEHLEELRSRILKALVGIGVAFVASLIFANDMWKIVSEPAIQALRTLGFQEKLAQITPMETFSTVWVKLPMLAAIFLASPWVLYQVWGFIAPGLYRRERRWAAPFVICSAGLFISGGLFAYFVAFRFGLTFLLGIGRDINIQPMVSVTEYFDLFVNVMLGVGLVFELPVLIFFLTLLRIVTPGFLIRNSRYAILVIVVLAAIVTPTPDVFNLMLFAVPMCLLFYVGIFAGYLLILHREQRSFPWAKVLPWVALVLALLGGVVWYITQRYGLHIVTHWPFLVK
ncbi:MAG TPA: twin-arginine translocase subunit TatC [Bryobacteraceae bacterium]|nr:twin-arginine translocase subunit TatC [Bryobacteraceae bacterium]